MGHSHSVYLLTGATLLTTLAVKPTLLFVDDEPDVLDVLTKMFERSFNVISVRSGAQALALLQADKSIDLLITDQKMPEMTGTELVAKARALGIDTCAILLTAYTQPNDLIAAINQGQVYRYVTKPWDVNDLVMTVKNALQFVALKREKEHLLETLRKRLEALSVLYEVSRGPVGATATPEAVVDRLLQVIGRVLPHDASAVLVQASDGPTASLRIHARGTVGEKALLYVKDSVLSKHRKTAGVVLPEDKVLTHIFGTTSAAPDAPTTFPGSVAVPLVAGGQVVGTLAIFSALPAAYSTDDGELLDLLVNQTTDAIAHLRAADQDARRRTEQMVEAMNDGVVLTNEKSEIVVMNAAARAMLKLADEPEPQAMRLLQERLGFAPFETVRGWEYSGQKVYREDVKLFERTVHLTLSPVVESRGRLAGVLVVLRDVTEQKLLEERKDEFISMVSHELRTPLTSVTGALDLVLNHVTGDINDKQRRYLEMARESTDKLNALVDDLLDLSKFAQGQMRMNLQFTHLDEVVLAAAERYQPAFLERRIKLTVDVAERTRVLADSGRVSQVLNNLLTNAVKFTPEGGEAKIELKVTADAPGFAAVSVSNSGEAIDEANLERIFNRFEQARTASNRAVRGTGLGLSICKSIVEAHGGRIWAEPVSTGARFVAVLPVEPAGEAVRQAPVVATPNAPPRGTVLVVDDQAECAWAVKAALLNRGYRVVIATSGEEALLAARKHRPDIITLDIRLPDIDGLRLAEIFRHDPDTKQARVLVLSGLDERERALRSGATAFLRKPVAQDTLLAAVDGLVGSARRSGRVLVVDDDSQICAICIEVLSNLGFEAMAAKSLAEARRAVLEFRPELLLLDVMLPDGDGLTFFEELKAERASSPLPVVFISARTETSAKVRALKLGGDDYITKPFDALELGARIESVLRRRSAESASSPTTQLPGPAAIEKEVQRRLTSKAPFAFCYLDLDNLKAYNDYYGFAKADGVVRQTGDLLRDIFAAQGRTDDFLGHVAGDDFVFITSLETVDGLCMSAIESFDRIIPLYYDKADRERGHIEAEDRFGERRQFPIMSVSVVAVICDGSGALDHSELARQAAELKKRAKAVSGSVLLRSDRPMPKPVGETG